LVASFPAIFVALYVLTAAALVGCARARTAARLAPCAHGAPPLKAWGARIFVM
jgi:hypothetical protein